MLSRRFNWYTVPSTKNKHQQSIFCKVSSLDLSAHNAIMTGLTVMIGGLTDKKLNDFFDY